jgi:hypothetical protein
MLFFGILATIVSIVWFVQILGEVIRKNNAPLYSFLDPLLNQLASGSLGFLSTMIYGILVYYLQICLLKGYTKFGLRIPFIISFHSMRINKTYMNSLLFNTNMMMLASVATSLVSVMVFPNYLKNTYLSRALYNQFDFLPFFGPIYSLKIPPGIL